MLDKTDYQIGLEVEHFRVTAAGQLSELPHPVTLDKKYFKSDAYESQLEIITPIYRSVDEAMASLADMFAEAKAALPAGEILWPWTMPPEISADRHELHYSAETPERLEYYLALEKKFGKTGSIPMGAHMNVSVSGFTGEDYVNVARALLAYRWLFTYLTGASPVANPGYWDQAKPLPARPVRSLRGSREFGYGFASHMTSDFSSVEAYAKHVENLIVTGVAVQESAYREVVRLRHRDGLQGLLQGDVHYLELRLFDLDPDSPAGIAEWLVKFVFLFVLFAQQTQVDYDQQKAMVRHNIVALEVPTVETVFANDAQNLLADMAAYFTDPADKAVIAQAKALIDDPTLTPAAKMVL
ncbi:MAG TPA: glutamate-cysteine ligase family protein [Lactobacillaceae bacterium]|jgi:glutamate--cysteine ligase